MFIYRSSQAEEADNSYAADPQAVQAETPTLLASHPRARELQEIPRIHGSYCTR